MRKIAIAAMGGRLSPARRHALLAFYPLPDLDNKPSSRRFRRFAWIGAHRRITGQTCRQLHGSIRSPALPACRQLRPSGPIWLDRILSGRSCSSASDLFGALGAPSTCFRANALLAGRLADGSGQTQILERGDRCQLEVLRRSPARMDDWMAAFDLDTGRLGRSGGGHAAGASAALIALMVPRDTFLFGRRTYSPGPVPRACMPAGLRNSRHSAPSSPLASGLSPATSRTTDERARSPLRHVPLRPIQPRVNAARSR